MEQLQTFSLTSSLYNEKQTPEFPKSPAQNSMNQTQKSRVYPYHARKLKESFSDRQSQDSQSQSQNQNSSSPNATKSQFIKHRNKSELDQIQDKFFNFGGQTQSVRLPFLNKSHIQNPLEVSNIILGLTQTYLKSPIKKREEEDRSEKTASKMSKELSPQQILQNIHDQLGGMRPIDIKKVRKLSPYKQQKFYYDKELMFNRESQKRKRNYTEQYYKTRTIANSESYLNKCVAQVNGVKLFKEQDEIEYDRQQSQIKNKKQEFAIINMSKILDVENETDYEEMMIQNTTQDIDGSTSAQNTTVDILDHAQQQLQQLQLYNPINIHKYHEDELKIESGIDKRFRFVLEQQARQPNLKDVEISNSEILKKIRQRYFQNYQIVPINTTTQQQIQNDLLKTSIDNSFLSIKPTKNRNNNKKQTSSLTLNTTSKELVQSRLYLPTKYSVTPKIRTASNEEYTKLLSNSNFILPQIFNQVLFKKVCEDLEKQKQVLKEQQDKKQQQHDGSEIQDNQKKDTQTSPFITQQKPEQTYKSAMKQPSENRSSNNGSNLRMSRTNDNRKTVSISPFYESTILPAPMTKFSPQKVEQSPRYLKVRPSINLEKDQEYINDTIKKGQKVCFSGKRGPVQYSEMALYLSEQTNNKKTKSIKQRMDEETTQILQEIFR